MKEWDLIHSKDHIIIANHTKERLMKILHRDCEFLATHNLMDYSILLIEEKQKNITASANTEIIQQDTNSLYSLGIQLIQYLMDIFVSPNNSLKRMNRDSPVEVLPSSEIPNIEIRLRSMSLC